MAATAGLLGTIAHGVGWPLPVGGSQSIIDALVADLRAHGGQILTGHRVRTWRDAPAARAVLLDTTAGAAADILSNRLPASLERALRRFPHGDGAAKVDFVLSGPVPWRDPDVGEAGTQHLGGTRAQMAHAEAEVAAGKLPQRPMTLVSDPSVVDPGRIHDGLRPLWAYAHVPAGDTTDPTELVTAQVERFAPGFRDMIVAARGIPASEMSAHNPLSRRRRHLDGPGHHGRDDRAPHRAAGSVPSGGDRLVPVLPGDPAGSRRARHVRLARRPPGAGPRVRRHGDAGPLPA